jgi:hypothetical protein
LWFYPDKEWENSLVNSLLKNGLEKSGINHFSLKRSNEETDSERKYSMIEWIVEHSELLKEVEFRQNLDNQHYFIGESRLEIGIDNKKDCFALHCLPFSGILNPVLELSKYILNHVFEYILPDVLCHSSRECFAVI